MPPKRDPRFNLGLISFSGLIEGIAAGTIFISLPYSVSSLPEGELFSDWAETSRIGFLISSFGLAMFFGQLLAGRLARNIAPRRSIAITGLAACAASTALLVLAESFPQLVLLRIIQGLSLALVIPTTASLLTAYSGPSSRGSALGFFSSAKTLGLALGPLAGGILIGYFGKENLGAVYGLGAGVIL
ncbi:MAG: MFS transporter, partial [Planctomycetes bacterium]|nr:MFS transporter [Planctomycetota bacterium]